MQLTIYLFAGLADRLGDSRIKVTCPGSSVTAAELKQYLANLYPAASPLIDSSILAVNQEYATGDLIITAKDEVALIPPVSGGQPETESSLGEGRNQHIFETEDGMYSISKLPLSVEKMRQKVTTANHGATLVFIGTTREMTGAQRTVFLKYEAYIPMALSKLQQIGKEVSTRWPGALCAISHRIGQVDIAESSVIIAVSTPHRDNCYEASRYAIERLKQIVPIWKQEQFEHETQWKGYDQGEWSPF